MRILNLEINFQSLYTYIHTYINTHLYIFIYIYTHTHIYIYIYMEVNNGNESNNIEKNKVIQREEFNVKDSQRYNVSVLMNLL